MKGGEKPMATKKAAVDPTGEFDYSKAVAYQVQEGDTLFSVAQKFLVAMQQLRYFNHIRPGRNLRVGKTIYIPKEPINVPVGK
ncbi:MAG: LysM peptidoglycan-binding domain-containing protein [Lactobacillus sp.]|nr:LysM peptidoglycan-binding domain-containing protein [Lactobacillus sp.]